MMIVSILSLGMSCMAMDDNLPIKFSRLSMNDGLSHNNVECIFKDSDDFMWFGTRSGLCRYNGYDFTVFRSKSDTASISGDRILCINQDKEGFLWVGTFNQGLNKYCPDTETFVRYKRDKNIGDRINRITVSRDGTLWICSNAGLASYNKDADSFTAFKHDQADANSLNSDNVHDLLETHSGELYVATEHNEIQLFDKSSKTFQSISYKRDAKLNLNYRKRLVEAPDGKIWIAAQMHGLSYYDPQTGESEIFTTGQGEPPSNILNGDMAMAPDGKLWITTDGDGVIILDLENMTIKNLRSNENESGTLSCNQIYTVYFDDRGGAWIGTFGRGICFFDPNQYKFLDHYNTPGDLQGLKNRSVTSLFQDENDELWIGTDGEGLTRLSPDGTIRNYQKGADQDHSLSSNSIISLETDPYGNILIGTFSGGLNVLDKQSDRITNFNHNSSHPGSINSQNVWDIFRDSKNRIWLGLLGAGVDLYDPLTGTFENYGPEANRVEKIDFPNVMDIMEDFDGDIWFGTEGKGVYILDKETRKIRQIASDSLLNSFSSDIILSLMQDHWGYIWIGTEGSGLIRYNKRTGKTLRYTSEDGLPSNIVPCILEDMNGNLWMGTANGLSMYNKETRKISSFALEEWLSGLECNRNALLLLSDGRIALGTTSGINIFNPESISSNNHIPKVVFSKLKVSGREVLPGDTIHKKMILSRSLLRTEALTLTHREKNFAIEFAALNYTLPWKCRYEYMLEDIDDKWTQAESDQRTVQYSNLPPGNYVLKVRASNNDGIWGDNEKQLAINILPPFYNTVWFKIAAALIILLIIYLFFQSRLNLHRSNFMRIQLEQEHKIMELEKEKLESELNKLTFHILNRNRFLIDQKNRLTGLTVKAKESVRVCLQDIITKLYDELNDDKDWKYIEPQLDKVYSNFVSRLKEKHKDLTISEIKIASYVRMDLTTKEISEFMHKTSRAVENDRYRLRKKLGLDINDSLQKYLMNL